MRIRRTAAALITCVFGFAGAAHAETPAAALEYVRFDQSKECIVADTNRAMDSELAIKRAINVPDHFVGNATYDPASGRLWLVAFGPPFNTHGRSKLYELDFASGRVLAEAEL